MSTHIRCQLPRWLTHGRFAEPPYHDLALRAHSRGTINWTMVFSGFIITSAAWIGHEENNHEKHIGCWESYTIIYHDCDGEIIININQHGIDQVAPLVQSSDSQDFTTPLLGDFRIQIPISLPEKLMFFLGKLYPLVNVYTSMENHNLSMEKNAIYICIYIYIYICILIHSYISHYHRAICTCKDFTTDF